MKRKMSLLFLLILILLCFSVTASEPTGHQKPNILIILADDMGFSDLGCFGGEVQTPNLDRLAANGLRYTQFYNTARCWPSRAAILTGYYAQQVRRDTIPGLLATGNGGTRPHWARLLPDYLKPAGYRAYHSGKWHLDGWSKETGFDHSYRVDDQDRYFSPHVHYQDDQPLPPVKPGSGYYATTAIADHAIECLKEHAEKYSDRPFFHYLAFTCPHFPLHALPEDIAKYRDRYRDGWDVLRAQRLERMKSLGILRCDLSPRTPGVPAWDSLPAEEKERWSVRMAIHAAMVDRMDQEIGRVLDQLKAMGAYENTAIFFLSDNGASAEIIDRGDMNDPKADPGSAKSFLCLEPAWANLANAPLRRSKIFVHEGGISTPLIVHWPRGLQAKGELRSNPGHVIDLAPTILDLTGAKKPRKWKGEVIPPAPGHSLLPTFARDRTVDHNYLWWFHSDNRAVRVGDWKLVTEGRDAPWELYNLGSDRSEIHNLAANDPERVHEMEQAWTKHMEEFRALAAPLAGKKPNIIFVLTDDQGYGDLSCTGNPILQTPNIDRLYNEGIRFTDFHVSPTCSPTRSALMTGRHEFKNGVTHTILERERLTLNASTVAQALKRAGYVTGIFGKWHLGDEALYQPDRRGFDEVFIHGGGGIGQTYPGSCGDAPGNTYFNPTILHNGKFERTQGYCTDVFFGQATHWMEAKKGKKPFFAYIACNAPHEPLQVRPEDEARYAGKVGDPKVAKFYGMIANIDDNVGRLLEKLKAWGIENDTLVIFMNDNGGTAGVKVYNAGMRGQKVTPFLGGTRAASFWRWPSMIAPGEVKALTAHVDFFPTLADIAGVKLTKQEEKQIEGRSLLSLLQDANTAWTNRRLFTHVGRWPKGANPSDYKYADCGVRSARWHLVSASQGKEKHWMLFDVLSDPGELKDLAGNRLDIVNELDAAYDRWWDSVLPMMVNEKAVGPKENPFKVRYRKQFGNSLPR